jgi:hypothetical protein
VGQTKQQLFIGAFGGKVHLERGAAWR